MENTAKHASAVFFMRYIQDNYQIASFSTFSSSATGAGSSDVAASSFFMIEKMNMA